MSSSWVAHTDPGSGNTYYHNTSTNETTWEKPAEFDGHGASAVPSRGGPPPIPQAYLARVGRASVDGGDSDVSSGEGSVVTAVTVTPPVSAGVGVGAGATSPATTGGAHTPDSAAGSVWQRAVDSSTGRDYYYNTETNEVRWEPPAEYLSPAAAPQSPAATSVSSPSVSPASSSRSVGMRPVANNEYDRVLDPNTNRYYFVHRATQHVQWEVPPGWVEPETRPAAVSAAVPKSSQSAHSRTQSWSPAMTTPQPAAPSGGPRLAPLAEESLSAPQKVRKPNSMPMPMPKDFNVLPTPLREDIRQFQMEGFAMEHFRKVKKRSGFTKKVVPMAELVQWQNSLIEKSLLEKANSNNSNAVKAFKLIMGFMGDRPSKKTKGVLANTLISFGMKRAELRDEIYCQVVKQTTNNPNPESAGEGWKLLALCVHAFAPSRGLQEFILNHCVRFFNDENPVIESMAPFCHWRLQKTLAEGPPSNPPSITHINSLAKDGVPPRLVAFGGTLSYILKLQHRAGISDTVPEILRVLTDAVMATGGAQQVGIFRLAAERHAIEALEKQLREGNYDISDVDDPHVLADLLKIWLRGLSEPLIPKANYDECLEIGRHPEKVIEFCQTKLPPAHVSTMDYLARWLNELAKSANVTNMTIDNLAIVFCSNILKTDNPDPTAMLRNSTREKVFVTTMLKHWPV